MVRRGIMSLAIVIVTGLAIGVGAQALAQTVTRDLVVTRDARVGDKVLAKGKYSISFDNKKDGELSIIKGGQELIKANYRLVDLGKDATSSAVIFTSADDGSFKVRRIEMKGAKMALQLD